MTIAIGGQTASGKTALAIEVAQRIDAEIISADSRQFYRGMDIGTAKPTAHELAQVTHHCINIRDIDQPITAGDFERLALDLHAQITARGKGVVIVGGSGLFLQALLYGLPELEAIDPQVKAEVEQRFQAEGIGYLLETLERLDPVCYGRIDRHNHVRLLRAVQVCISTGRPFSSYLQDQTAAPRPFQAVEWLVTRPREELYQRINQRVDAMIAEGLEEEVHSLRAHRHQTAMQTIGYEEWFPYFDGLATRAEVIDKIKQHSRNYAKRQGTWFRKYGNWKEVAPDADVEALLRKK